MGPIWKKQVTGGMLWKGDSLSFMSLLRLLLLLRGLELSSFAPTVLSVLPQVTWP